MIGNRASSCEVRKIASCQITGVRSQIHSRSHAGIPAGLVFLWAGGLWGFRVCIENGAVIFTLLSSQHGLCLHLAGFRSWLIDWLYTAFEFSVPTPFCLVLNLHFFFGTGHPKS